MTKVKIGAVAMALFLVGAYALAQGTKDAVDANSATVTVTWTPPRKSAGVTIIVRIAMQYKVKARTFVDSPFSETYPVKRGDNVLVTVDPIPVVNAPTEATCSIVIPGQPAINDAGPGHRTCLAVVK